MNVKIDIDAWHLKIAETCDKALHCIFPEHCEFYKGDAFARTQLLAEYLGKDTSKDAVFEQMTSIYQAWKDEK